MSDERLDAREYLEAVTRHIAKLLDWRERWVERTPETEPALLVEWEHLANQAQGIIAIPVEGDL